MKSSAVITDPMVCLSQTTPKNVLLFIMCLYFCKQKNSIGVRVYYQCVDAMSICALKSVIA